MSSTFTKLNLKDQTEIIVLNAPSSFNVELKTLNGVKILRDARDAKQIDFVLAFVTTKEAIERCAKAFVTKIHDDAIVWFAYPKGTSKKYTCDFNRDTGWDFLGKSGFERVRQVAIDDDWSALRFRRVEFIKSMTRRNSFAMTKQGKAKTRK
jgi:hypothetical protein